MVLLAGLHSSFALNLPRVFSDHMVLQRDAPVKIWGWANPGKDVTVTFADQKKTVRAGKDGKWMATLDSMPARFEPDSLLVNSGDENVTIKNILVGEVWICSGQSNMEWTLGGTDNAKEAIANANYPLIRQFKVTHVTNVKPQRDLPGAWKICSPETANNFTGVGYHFGLDLHRALNGVPIGLINTSWGGTRIEPWTDPLGFNVSPKLKGITEQIKKANQKNRNNVATYLDRLDAWSKECRDALANNKDLPAYPGGLPNHPLNKANLPTAIYHAMIAPLVPYSIRGAIWYQGESNNGEGMQYFEKMKALIGSWRRLWDQGDFPFLFVQLAPYKYNRPDALPGIWEAQLASLTIPNTGMAVITDIGNVADIHPRNKKEVGRRLSLWALADTYGKKDLVYSGPLYDSVEFKGKLAFLKFHHAQGLKSMDDNPLNWFTIAGPDKEFYKATVEIQDDTLVVSSDQVTNPQSVRFGWNELAEPNFANGADLPASPFRTDSW